MEEVTVIVPKTPEYPSYVKDKYYVYALFKKSSHEPFYVGKGINSRVAQHFMNSSLQESHSRKNKTIRKYGKAGIRKEILAYFDNEQNAFDFEEYLIDHYKLIEDGGVLYNVARSRHEFPETSKKIISEKKTARTVVYTEADVLTLYKNYFEKRMSLRECIQGTSIPRRYSSAICRGERFKGLYKKYIESGEVKNLRMPEDNYMRKDPENMKFSDEILYEFFHKACYGSKTVSELAIEMGCTSIWLSSVFNGKHRTYLKLDVDLFKEKYNHRERVGQREYSKFLELYKSGVTDKSLLTSRLNKSLCTVSRYIRRYNQTEESLNGTCSVQPSE